MSNAEKYKIIKNVLFGYSGTDTELRIPEGVEAIASRAFGYVNVKRMVIPASVNAIDRGAFCRCIRLEYLEIQGTPDMDDVFFDPYSKKTYTGTLLIPNMEPSKLPKSLKDRALESYCKASLEGRDFGEDSAAKYNAYFKRNRKKICKNPLGQKLIIEYMLREKLLDLEDIDALLELVQGLGDRDYLTKVTAYQASLDGGDEASRQERARKKAEKEAKAKAKKEAQIQAVQDYDNMSLSERVKVKRKRNPQTKVELLEEVVLKGTLEDLENVYATCESFEFTARALGYAARYSGVEMVRFLAEHGATFAYPQTPAIEAKYDYKIHISNHYDTVTKYFLYLLEDHKVRNEPAGVNVLAAAERAKVLEYLVQHRESLGFDAEEVYYYAALYAEVPILDACGKLGIQKMPKYYLGRVCDSRQDGYDIYFRNQVSWAFRDSAPAKLKITLEHLFPQLGEEKMRMLPYDLYNETYLEKTFLSHYCAADVFALLCRHTNMLDRVGKWDILYGLVANSNSEGLIQFLQEQGEPGRKDLEKLLNYAQGKEEVSPDTKAVILEKLNQLPAPKQKDSLSLSANPLSVAEMKKVWSFKKRPDGTSLIITAYKGEQPDVVVPSVIGKTKVRAVESYLFEPPVNHPDRVNVWSVEIPGTIRIIPYYCFSKCPELKRVVLGEGVKQLEERAFTNCTALEEVVLPETLCDVAVYAFEDCKALKEIVLPASITELKKGVFSGCGFESFTVPEHIKVIGSEVFSNCKNLKQLQLPQGIQKIPMRLFVGSGLESFEIPDTVQEIGAGAFSNCSQLKQVRIPKSVTTIENGVFFGCGFEELTIPAHITAVKDRAFANCKSLKKVIFENENVQISQCAFEGCEGLANEQGLVIVGDTVYGCISDDRKKPMQIPQFVKHMDLAKMLPRLPYITWQGESEETAALPEISSLQRGDEVQLGRFAQETLKRQPITWIVLAQEQGRALLLAKKGLVSMSKQAFSEDILQKDTWEASQMRQWLNDEFLHTVFSEEEQALIEEVTLTNPNNKKTRAKGGPNTEDRIFLLNADEIQFYLPQDADRRAEGTPYAAAQKRDQRRMSAWMTRTPGKDGYGRPAGVYLNGEIELSGAVEYMLRPALWIKEKQ